ncbi:HlyD family secretion protein [Bradyrhizobium sp. HKCCYLS3077]|uniref:HlyD family secretion protein n=1 Tax=Bradyrhizobium sp. HKCCYLS3077 TaxID=3420761 RepID=UPI003EBE22A8
MKVKYVLTAALVAVIAAGLVIYQTAADEPVPPIVGVVRATEIGLAPEIGGQLASMEVRKGMRVHAGDVLATLSAVELTAQIDQARAALAAAIANRNHVFAGVRREQVDSLRSGILKANARLDFMQMQLARTSSLTRQNVESLQALDQAQHDADTALMDVAQAQALYDAAVAGPTPQERAIAEAQVQAASAAVEVLARKLDKTVLRAPADGIVSVVVAEVGENVRAGQPVLTLEASGRTWLSFNVREDHLEGLAVGRGVRVGRAGSREIVTGSVTEIRRLGAFATWQARRVVGDHDRNTLRLRVDPSSDRADLEPGMTVWIER